jgi:hypothetical protein
MRISLGFELSSNFEPLSIPLPLGSISTRESSLCCHTLSLGFLARDARHWEIAEITVVFDIGLDFRKMKGKTEKLGTNLGMAILGTASDTSPYFTP